MYSKWEIEYMINKINKLVKYERFNYWYDGIENIEYVWDTKNNKLLSLIEFSILVEEITHMKTLKYIIKRVKNKY